MKTEKRDEEKFEADFWACFSFGRFNDTFPLVWSDSARVKTMELCEKARERAEKKGTKGERKYFGKQFKHFSYVNIEPSTAQRNLCWHNSAIRAAKTWSLSSYYNSWDASNDGRNFWLFKMMYCLKFLCESMNFSNILKLLLLPRRQRLPASFLPSPFRVNDSKQHSATFTVHDFKVTIIMGESFSLWCEAGDTRVAQLLSENKKLRAEIKRYKVSTKFPVNL